MTSWLKSKKNEFTLVDALIDWKRKADQPLRAALASRPPPAAEADRTALVQWLDKFIEPG